MIAIADPRVFGASSAPPGHAARLHALARASLDAATGRERDRADAAIGAVFAELIAAGAGAALAQVFETAPAADVHRHLWRQLARTEAAPQAADVAVTVFAMPVVIVAGVSAGDAPGALSGLLPDAGSIADLLREHGALGGNRSFALADALVSPDAIDLAHLPQWLRWRPWSGAGAAATGDAIARPELAPAPIELAAGAERVHLRFLVGSALAAPGVDLVADTSAGKWGLPLSRLLSGWLARPGASALALPQAPRRLVPALHVGRAAQREVSAQVFASNALRRLRASVGEPSAVISAHRAPDAPCRGELRLSLSSALAPAQAEGFRCPLYAADQVQEVAETLATLARDCRVSDVRVLPGLHADRDPQTGLRLLFKAHELSPGAAH